MTEFSDRLRAERVRAGLSQTALAGDDFSPSYISLIEAGRRVPTDRALSIMAGRLGTSAEYLRWGDQAPSEERARLELGYARIALANGEAEDALNRLLALDRDVINPRHRIEADVALAHAFESLGRLEEAVAVLEPLLRDLRAERRWTAAATQAAYLVAIYWQAGDLSHSIEIGEAVLADLEGAGLAGTDEHLRLASTILWSYYQRGDLLFAAHRASGLIDMAERNGSRRGRGSVYWNASLVAEGRAEYGEARRLAERALAYLSEAESNRDVPRLRLHYGWLLLRSDPPEPALALEQLSLALDGLTNVGSELEIARCLYETGRAHLLLGDPDLAERLVRSGLERIGDSGEFDACDAHIVLGDTLAARDRMDAAQAEYHWAADRLSMLAAGRQAASVWRSVGDRLRAMGDAPGAAAAYARALEEAGIRPTTFSMTARDRITVGFGEGDDS